MDGSTFHMEVEGLKITVEPRGAKGTYNARFHFNGNRRFSLKTRNKREAERRAPKVVREFLAAQAKTFKGETLSFEMGRLHYENFLVAENKSNRTIVQARRRTTSFVEFLRAQGVDSFEEIRRPHAQAFLEYVRNNGARSDSTAAGYLSFARAMLSHLAHNELIGDNPFDHIKVKKSGSRSAAIPELSELNQILSQVSPDWLAPMAAAAFLGCRQASLIRIRHDDVSLENRMVYIRKPDHGTKVVSRFVPIHQRLLDILRDYERPDSEWFFCSRPSPRYPKGGSKLKAEAVNTEFKRAAAAAGFPVGRFTEHGMTFHCLRGFFKTHAVHAGVPREVIDAWQGHTDRSVGTRHYFNLTKSKSIEWMDKIKF